ncbi:MAG: MFS transporter [Novosphingobium sp.]|jgi:MFS family permease|nr:MFS transporter [Novosphingobium sp.]
MQPLRDNTRILIASAAGTAVEYYDFFLYGTAAALVFGPLFFPASSPAAQTLFAFMSFGIAFLARPIGAIAFGHFGDRVGRKSTLVASLLLMGGATLAIAFVPSYAMIGWPAPALLCLLRFCQGFGLGGEWGGAALLVVENAPKGWETRFVAIMQLGSPAGFILATGVVMLLSLSLDNAAFVSWGWRIPFIASAALVLIGLWVRLRIGETAAFRAALAHAEPERVPLVKVFAEHWGAVLAGAAGVIATFATFYLVTTYALAQGTGPAGYPRDAFLAVQMLAALFYAAGLLIAGVIGDRISPGRLLAFASLGVAIAGLFFGPGLNAGSLPLAGATLCVTMLALGFANCPLGAWLSPLFPVRLRYSGVSFAFSIGGVIGGALTPIGAQAMSVAGYADHVGLLLVAAGLLTFLGVLLARPADEPALSVPVRSN